MALPIWRWEVKSVWRLGWHAPGFKRDDGLALFWARGARWGRFVGGRRQTWVYVGLSLWWRLR